MKSVQALHRLFLSFSVHRSILPFFGYTQTLLTFYPNDLFGLSTLVCFILY